MPTGSGVVGQARPRLGVNSFQHRFGLPLNRHVHLHDCVSDRVFEQGVDGVFTPDHPLRPAVTTMVIGNQAFSLSLWERARVRVPPNSFAAVHRTTLFQQEQDHVVVSCYHDTSWIAWAKLLPWVGEAFPLA